MATRTSRIASALGTGALALITAACSTPVGAGPAPCESVYTTQCTTACTSDRQCAGGLYCGPDQTCTADCAPGARGCSSSYTCTSNGRCVATNTLDAGDGATTSDVPSNDTPFVGDACADVTVQLDRQPPTLMLLIDQSASMNDRFGGTTKWNAIRDTLVNSNTGVVHALDADVRFGLAMYSANDMTCPLLAPNPALSPALNNYTAIARELNRAQPVRYTPTGDAIRAITPVVAADNSPGIRAIVLATDGEPGTCSDLMASQSTGARLDAARQASVDAVAAAFAMGIRTYVISVGSGAADAHMQALANAGSGTSNATFFRALDPTSLTNAFSMITSGVRSCTFTVHGTIDPNGASQGDVRLDGMQLIYGDANGWRLVGNNQIELLGTACMQAQTNASTLSARFPCGIATPG